MCCSACTRGRGLFGEEAPFNAASYYVSSAHDLFVQDGEWSHVSALRRHSLVVDSPAFPGHVAMNSHVQDVVREQLMGGSRTAALGGVLQLLGLKMAAFDPQSASTHEGRRRYARHVQAAASHVRSEGEHPDVVSARNTIAHV